MYKQPVYFVPGLAASSKIFEHITLSNTNFETHFLHWFLPTTSNESIESYAQRMCMLVNHENPILIGVSFGGVIVQEMSKQISCKKVIIISSIKSNKEFPKLFKVVQLTKAYKLFPTHIIANIEKYEYLFFNDYLKKRIALYKIYLSVRDKDYLKWAIHHILHWKQHNELANVIHIHGDKDEVFPIENIKSTYTIENGTHIMILNRAKKISKVLEKECFC